MAVCVNKWDVSPEYTQAIRDYCREQEIPFVGQIPYDREASRAINEGRTLAEVDCPAARALREIFDDTCKLLK